jgi:hypothetical protein
MRGTCRARCADAACPGTTRTRRWSAQRRRRRSSAPLRVPKRCVVPGAAFRRWHCEAGDVDAAAERASAARTHDDALSEGALWIASRSQHLSRRYAARRPSLACMGTRRSTACAVWSVQCSEHRQHRRLRRRAGHFLFVLHMLTPALPAGLHRLALLVRCPAGVCLRARVSGRTHLPQAKGGMRWEVQGCRNDMLDALRRARSRSLPSRPTEA